MHSYVGASIFVLILVLMEYGLWREAAILAMLPAES